MALALTSDTSSLHVPAVVAVMCRSLTNWQNEPQGKKQSSIAFYVCLHNARFLHKTNSATVMSLEVDSREFALVVSINKAIFECPWTPWSGNIHCCDATSGGRGREGRSGRITDQKFHNNHTKPSSSSRVCFLQT